MNTQIIVLAGGLGKRMGGDAPKALVPLRGKPLISYLLDSIEQSKVSDTPVIVVGKKADMVKKVLGSSYWYILQREQLGTAHAVLVCKDELAGKYENIVVLYGDHPMVSAEVIRKLVEHHGITGATISLMTVDVSDFKEWRQPFYGYGRIIRDHKGVIHSIVELKDCTEEQKSITEVNPNFFCFNAVWLWENIENINNQNAQKEYYLTDLLAMAISQRKKVVDINVDPKTAIGVNTPEQLAIAEGLVGE